MALVETAATPALPVPVPLSAHSRPGALMRELPLAARLYVAGALAVALTLIAFAVPRLPGDKVDEVVVLGVLYLISESLSSRGSRDMLTISLGSVVIMAAIPLVGVWG